MDYNAIGAVGAHMPIMFRVEVGDLPICNTNEEREKIQMKWKQKCKVDNARERHGKPFACDPKSTFRYRRDRTILDDWMANGGAKQLPPSLREQAF